MSASDLREAVEVELEQIGKTLGRLQRLLDAAHTRAPDDTSIVAAAAYVANLYAGGERIFKLIARERGVALPSDPAWHRRLLDMFGPEHPQQLPQLVDEPLRESMDGYLGFRHLFVHGYSVDLDWERLSPAAGSAAQVFGAFTHRVREYLKILGSRGES